MIAPNGTAPNGSGRIAVPFKYPAQAPSSAVAGYLAPGAGSPLSFDAAGLGLDQGLWDGGTPLDDDALDNLLQGVVAGITGLALELVRPRWQPEPPNQPDFEVDWCAVGIVGRTSDTYAWTGHFPDGAGYDLLLRQEELDTLVTFYGPHSDGMASRLRDGLAIDQNRTQLWLADMELRDVGELQRTAELIKNRWLARADLHVNVSRQVRRIYPILSLLSASGTVAGDRPVGAQVGPVSTFDTTRVR